MNRLVRANRAPGETDGEQGDSRLDTLQRGLRGELSRLAEQVQFASPDAAAVIIDVQVGGVVYVGGHGPRADSIISLLESAHPRPNADASLGSAPVLDGPVVLRDQQASPSDGPLHPGSGGIAMVVPLPSSDGSFVGSVTLYADSAAALPSSSDAAFGAMIARLGRAVSSIRTVAVAELTSVLIRRGPVR